MSRCSFVILLTARHVVLLFVQVRPSLFVVREMVDAKNLEQVIADLFCCVL